MTRLISIFIVAVVVFCAWRVYRHWEQVQQELHANPKSDVISPDSLAGLPPELQHSYQLVRTKETAVMRNWLNTYGHMINDPRKAWIELDFCTAIARENPAEARGIFADVKARTPESSPVWPRIKQLEASFE